MVIHNGANEFSEIIFIFIFIIITITTSAKTVPQYEGAISTPNILMLSERICL